MVYSTERSEAVVPVLVLFFVALWFILRGDLFSPCLVLFCSCIFSVLLALRLPRLGKRELNIAFLMFLWFALAWFCLFPPPFRVMIVTLPGYLSYLFYSPKQHCLFQ